MLLFTFNMLWKCCYGLLACYENVVVDFLWKCSCCYENVVVVIEKDVVDFELVMQMLLLLWKCCCWLLSCYENVVMDF